MDFSHVVSSIVINIFISNSFIEGLLIYKEIHLFGEYDLISLDM
jgi:hypothetical protein